MSHAHASGQHYRCVDAHGNAYRLPTRIETSLMQFNCVLVGDRVPARAPAATQPLPYASIALTVPPAEASAHQPPRWRPGAESSDIDELIADTARRFGHDAHLMRAIVRVESAFNARAVSSKGAIGLMQLMPATARRYGVEKASDLFDPATNLLAGARYLADLHRLFPRRIELVLAAYNAGEGAVIRRNYSVPPYPETQAYVRSVLSAYDGYVAAQARAGAE